MIANRLGATPSRLAKAEGVALDHYSGLLPLVPPAEARGLQPVLAVRVLIAAAQALVRFRGRAAKGLARRGLRGPVGRREIASSRHGHRNREDSPPRALALATRVPIRLDPELQQDRRQVHVRVREDRQPAGQRERSHSTEPEQRLDRDSSPEEDLEGRASNLQGAAQAALQERVRVQVLDRVLNLVGQDSARAVGGRAPARERSLGLVHRQSSRNGLNPASDFPKCLNPTSDNK